MSLKLNSSGGGSVTIQEPTTASDFTLTLPAATGTFNVSGAVNEVPAGSASAPSIYPTGDTNTGIFFPAADTIAFTEGGVESARIDSSGRLMLGTTTTSITNAEAKYFDAADGMRLFSGRASTASREHVIFQNPNGTVGSISTSGSSTTYSTSSDYRLKQDIAPMTGALTRVAALKPVTYKWKVDGTEGQGFIAHELQAVVPECVSGKKDEVNADGNPVYQGIDTSFLVATLTAAIQELKAELDSVKATLKGAA
jgi:hypothetical protein